MMDIVCPVHNKDFDRFKTLFRSLEKFCLDEFRVFLVSDGGNSPIYDPKIVPIKENSLDTALKIKKFDTKGWWKQQAIKLLSYKFCESEYILSMDADCFAVKNFSFSDLLYRKKIRTKISAGGSWDNWYIGSAKILKLPLSNNFRENRVGVTPFIFSNTILTGLNKYLKTLYSNTYIRYLLENTSLDETDSTWSEYCLYHIYGMNSGFWNKFHENIDSFELYGNCFWNENEANDWDINKSFTNPKFFFTVAQSIAGKPADWIENQIHPYV